MEIQFVLGIRLLPLVWLAYYIGLSTKHGQHIDLLSFRLNLATQARYYPVIPVIPVVIPKKRGLCQDGKMTQKG